MWAAMECFRGTELAAQYNLGVVANIAALEQAPITRSPVVKMTVVLEKDDVWKQGARKGQRAICFPPENRIGWNCVTFV